MSPVFCLILSFSWPASRVCRSASSFSHQASPALQRPPTKMPPLVHDLAKQFGCLFSIVLRGVRFIAVKVDACQCTGFGENGLPVGQGC